jgi:hypothetical protein
VLTPEVLTETETILDPDHIGLIDEPQLPHYSEAVFQEIVRDPEIKVTIIIE